MPERAYKLLPKGPLHIGTWGIGQEQTLSYVPSDTLFSALVVAWAALDPSAVPDLLAPLLAQGEDGSLYLSSAFPYAGPVRFFPRPRRAIVSPAEVSLRRLRRADWVSEGLFALLTAGALPLEHVDEVANLVQGDAVWVTRKERASIAGALNVPDDADDPGSELRLWSRGTTPRVAVDRRSNASNLFHSGRQVFAEGCGLWLAARAPDHAPLAAGLTYLQDAGLGGLRSAGHGAFEWQTWADAAPLAEPAGDAYFVSLSRYAPAPSEYDRVLRAPEAAFQLDTVAGWCVDDAHHAWRRKQVRMVAEGAYLGWPGRVPGQLVDVTPDGVGAYEAGRRVYRYGLAFPVAAG
ncbi:MAG: type III-A CRISPR-associated RAMP protein Csm4 [Anaerolineae bacterium]|nr:type III-A CRISPR-associated RAMP protein Csm4 [Anaerolineae bacterium]